MLVHVGVGPDGVVLGQLHAVLPEDLAEGGLPVVAPAGDPSLVVLVYPQRVRVPDLHRVPSSSSFSQHFLTADSHFPHHYKVNREEEEEEEGGLR